MRKVFVLLIMIIIIITNLYSENIYIYVEETYNNEEPSISSPAKNGLLDGLFELGHIVFDDIQGEGEINWDNEVFDGLVGKAAYGGARFLFVVKIATYGEVNDDNMMSMESIAEYYYIDVRIVQIIAHGSINMDNFYKENEINREELGFSLGSELSFIVDAVYKEYIIES